MRSPRIQAINDEGSAMHSNVADLNEQTVRLVRFGPSTNRPHSPPQPLWRGLPPEGVRIVLTRDALAEHFRDWYAQWASNLAVLTDGFLVQVFEQDLNSIRQLQRGEWTELPFVDCHRCRVGDDYLWVQKQDGGWTVELCHPGADPDARVLAIADMPVLCPDAPSAARLALACYLKPPANLIWQSYW
jgi:hypothetical protein